MTLAFYMDEHVHKGITEGLRQREVDVLTVQEDDRAGMPDPELLDRATVLQRVLFTQDQDFLVEASRRQMEAIFFVGVIYGHQRLVTIGACVSDLEIIAKTAELKEMENCVQYLPL